MAQIPQFGTGVPVPMVNSVRFATINRTDVVAAPKNLFRLRDGEMITELTMYGTTVSNAVTTGTVHLGFKNLNNAQTAAGPLVGIYITNVGVGYTSAPVITFTGGGGTGAAATAVINSLGQVVGLRITNPGSGYTSAPTVVFTGGGFSVVAAAVAIPAIPTALVATQDVRAVGAGSGQVNLVSTALYVPMQFGTMVTGYYGDTGGAATAGGPWIIIAKTVQPSTNYWNGFFPASFPIA